MYGIYAKCNSYNTSNSNAVLNFSPLYTVNTFTYSLSLTSQYYSCNIMLLYHSTSTILISYNNTASSPSIIAAPSSGSFTTANIPLISNSLDVIIINSTLDGVYELNIVRGNWDVVTILVQSVGSTGAFLSYVNFTSTCCNTPLMGGIFTYNATVNYIATG